MTNGSIALLVDTNVLVYAFDRSEGVKRERAIEVLDEIASRGVGALSVQVLGEFYNTVTRRIPSPLTAGQAQSTLTGYVRDWTVFDLTKWTVLEAARVARRYQFAYWDALIWAAARMNGVPGILTEDTRGREELEGVRYYDPFADTFDLTTLTA